VLQQEGSLTHAAAAFDAYQAVAPVNLVHQFAADGTVHMFNQVLVCSVKCFHNNLFLFVTDLSPCVFRICAFSVGQRSVAQGKVHWDEIFSAANIGNIQFTAKSD
jgi:hypothetical protein